MNSKEGEMSNLQMKEKLSHSPDTHDSSIQKIVLWNMQMKIQNLTKPDQLGLSSSIRLKVMCLQSFWVLFFPTVSSK